MISPKKIRKSSGLLRPYWLSRQRLTLPKDAE